MKGGGLDARALGAIHTSERFSVVEVRADLVEDALRALRGTKLRGRKVTVRRDVEEARPGVASRRRR